MVLLERTIQQLITKEINELSLPIGRYGLYNMKGAFILQNWFWSKILHIIRADIDVKNQAFTGLDALATL